MSAAATEMRRPQPPAADAPSSTRLPAWAPAATCALLVAIGGLLTALVGLHITAWTLDETGYRVSAVHYASNLPHSLFNDYTARATSRLYALTVMPLFATFDGDVAIRIAKVYNCVLWCSIAVPLWHLARPLLTPWRRVAAVTLSVVAPWLVYTTALFTEALAMAGFVWFTWAVLCAVRRPAWWRDLLAIVAFGVAITARTQLGGILVGYLALIAFVLWRRSRASGGAWWWRTDRAVRELRHFPFTLLVLAVGAALVVKFAVAGDLSGEIAKIIGGYNNTRGIAFNDAGAMLLVEVLGIGAGIGVVAVLLSVPWYGRTLAGRRRDDAFWYAAATAATSIALVLATAYGQRSFWGDVTEERYWMYPFAFAWIAAFRAVQQRSVRPRDVAAVGAVFVVVAALIAPPRHLDFEGVFFAPVLGTLGSAAADGIRHVTTSPRDAVALAALVVCGGSWVILRRAPWLRGEWLLGGGAAIQLALTVVPLLAMMGVVAGGQAKRTGGDFAALGWVDRHAGGRAVVWLDSEPRRDQQQLFGVQLNTLFWNARIESRGGAAGATPAPDINPLDALPLATYTVDPHSGAVGGLPAGATLVAWRDSPYVQLGGRRLAASPQFPALELVRVDGAPRALLRTTGLVDGNETIPGPGLAPVRLDAWPGARGARLAFTFVGGATDATVRATLDGQTRRLAVPAGQTVTATLDGCGRRVRGALRTLEAGGVVALSSVVVTPLHRCPMPSGGRR